MGSIIDMNIEIAEKRVMAAKERKEINSSRKTDKK